MLVPKEILALAKLPFDSFDKMGNFRGIAVRRRPGNTLEALTVVNGHFTVAVTWQEIPQEDYPFIEGMQVINDPDLTVFIPCELAEKISKLFPKQKYMPILSSFFVEEKRTEKNGDFFVRAGLTDLDNSQIFNLPQTLDLSNIKATEDVLQMHENSYPFDTAASCTTVRTEYLSAIFQMAKAIFGKGYNTVDLQPGTDTDVPLRMTFRSPVSFTVTVNLLKCIEGD